MKCDPAQSLFCLIPSLAGRCGEGTNGINGRWKCTAVLPPNVHNSRITGAIGKRVAGLNGKNDKLLRLARGITLALPVAAAFFAASCTSTSTSLEVAGSSLQPSLNAPSLAQPVAAAQENSNTPAPSGPVQAGQVQIAGTSIAPTKAQTVGLASSATNPAETLQLASNAPGALPVPPIPESIQFPEPVVMTTAGETIPVPGSNEALIASAAKAAASAATGASGKWRGNKCGPGAIRR